MSVGRVVRDRIAGRSRAGSGLHRTPADVLRTVGRVVLWSVIAVLLVRGLSDVLARPEVQPGTRPAPSAASRRGRMTRPGRSRCSSPGRI